MGRIVPYIIMENNNHVPNHQPGKDGKSPWYLFLIAQETGNIWAMFEQLC